MYKKIWIIVISAILILTFSGCAPSKPDVRQSTVWKLQAPWWLITGKTSPEGFREFRKTLGESLGDNGSLLGGVAGHFLVERVEKHLKSIRRSDTIFLILPEVKEFEVLKELLKKYPELFPLSCDKLNELSSDISPLIYFAYDIQAEKLRGVVVADKVDISLAKLLVEKELPLDTLLQYKDGQLKEIKKK